MKITIKRGDTPESFTLDAQNLTVLASLVLIQETIDPSLAFSQGCRSGVCGSCAVRVNGRECLGCTTKIEDEDVIEPLRYAPIVKDLVVDVQMAQAKNTQALGFLGTRNEHTLSVDEERMIRVQSDCILCGSCYSACPVLAINDDFMGPFALTRNYRYVQDKREGDAKTKIDAVQKNGIWDCTLCGECSLVCPQGISSKDDINMLRTKSGMLGYTDPNALAFGDFGSFGNDFGPTF